MQLYAEINRRAQVPTDMVAYSFPTGVWTQATLETDPKRDVSLLCKPDGRFVIARQVQLPSLARADA
jgi:hypothetical protein